MEKIRAAVVGYGNIGRYVVETLRVSPDFEIAGIIRRNGSENCPDEIKDLKVVKDVKELGKVDVAILCTPTRKVEEHAIPLLEMGINTVDSFDIHTNIVELRRSLDAVAKKHGAVSVISAGWDPGSDSVVRALLEAIAPCYSKFLHLTSFPTVHPSKVKTPAIPSSYTQELFYLLLFSSILLTPSKNKKRIDLFHIVE